MNRRDIPSRILSRGREIARNGDLDIEYINNEQLEVDATVHGTYDYGVTVSVNGQHDYCECPYFPDHGYCKHIVAVLSLLKTQKRPIERLFSSVDDHDDYETLFEYGDYLENSIEFEQELVAHPTAAAHIYPDKKLYNDLRLHPENWDTFFDRYPDPVSQPATKETTTAYLDPDINAGIERYFAQYQQPQNRVSSGSLFLQNIDLPEPQYFKPLTNNATEEIPLALEVTLQLLPYSIYWGDSDYRAFISLRVASQQQGKFYKISNLAHFLTTYLAEEDYQTGGKAKFWLKPAVFSEAENQVLTILSHGSQPDNQRYQGNGNDRNQQVLLNTGDLARLIPVLSKITYFRYETEYDVYDQIDLTDYQPDNGACSVTVNPTKTGYDFILHDNLDRALPEDDMLIRENHFYQLTRPLYDAFSTFHDSYNQTADYDSDPDGYLAFTTKETDSLIQLINYFRQFGTINNLPETLVQPQMTPHFDLSTTGKQLQLQLTYDYDGTLYTKDQLDQATDIQRQFEKEDQAESYLHSLHFTNHNNTWEKDFSDPETLYQFFIAELPNLQANGVTTVTDDLQQLLKSGSEIKSAINVSEDNGLLSVNFSLKGIDEKDVDQMLQQLDVNRPYVARPDGSIMLVENDLKQLNQALISLRHQGKLHNGQIKVNAAQALAVQAAVGDTAQFDANFKRLSQDLAHPENFDISEEAPVQATLRPYQVTGVKWFEMLNSHGFGGILADEMGLGKTLQMITFLNNHLDMDHPDLVISPASLIYNWLAEFHKFAPDIKVAVVDGNKQQRREIVADTNNTVLITSYNSARRDVDLYNDRDINYLVLDEAQFVKNSATKTHQELRQLTRRNTYALSGTPIENRTEELWSIFALVMPGLLPNKTAFRKLTPDDIAIRVKPFILRREKEAVLTDLPPKIETNLTNDMTPEQKTVYLAQLQQMQVKVRGMSSSNFVKNRVEILAGLTRLRQICDTPSLYMDDYSGTSGKLEQLIELLHQAVENDRHVLIFSQFTSMLGIIEDHLKQANLPSYVLKGDTKPKDRLKMVDAFNAGEKSIFLISLKAGGTGLNLTGADMVILVDLWWNPAVEDQATARAHRIGQHHQVDVYRLITQGTIEEQIYKLQEQKRDLVDQILSGTQNKGALTEDEIREILGIEVE